MDQDTVQKIIAFRRNLHQFPEISFKQFQTTKKIKQFLVQLGVAEQSIRLVNQEGQEPTGLIVDLKGKAEPEGEAFLVAFRADIDALDMIEENQGLSYASKNKGAAHMCGHDGHTACLIAFVPWFLKNAQKIPSNKAVRLIFQPSQQGPFSGALFMIEKGCLEGVNEIYGMHNAPLATLGQVFCIPGVVFAHITFVSIKIRGEGGHGYLPNMKVSILKSMKLYNQIITFVSSLTQEGRKLMFTLPVFQAGERYNVISETTNIMGTLRTFQQQTREIVLNKLSTLLQEIKNQGFKVELSTHSFSATKNTQKETLNFLKIAKTLLGEDKIGPGPLPVFASEDFSFYLQKCPGTYFLVCTKEKDETPFAHSPKFNFNDAAIQTVYKLWVALAIDRLNLQGL